MTVGSRQCEMSIVDLRPPPLGAWRALRDGSAWWRNASTLTSEQQTFGSKSHPVVLVIKVGTVLDEKTRAKTVQKHSY